MTIDGTRKYIKVWVEKRKNPPKKDGSRSTSYVLEWVEFGRRQFQSLGPDATKTYAERMARVKENELNSGEARNSLTPVTWTDFRDKFLNTFYPGHELPKIWRQEKEEDWVNSIATMREERRVLDKFGHVVGCRWCHEITSEDRESFIQHRMKEVASGVTINKDLAILRHLFNVLEEWQHRPKDSNPFAGNGKATIGTKRIRQKKLKRQQAGEQRPEFYSQDQVAAILRQADKEVEEHPDDWCRHRLRALIYFVAYTGARLKEVLYVKWDDLDFEIGVAYLHARLENMLKTEDSAAPVGLADPLIEVLHQWKTRRRCEWVFPNLTKNTPWITGGNGYRPIDHLKALAKRAGVDHATWKMFRDTLATLGKSQFGLTEPQVQAMLRHTTTKTQSHYTHAELQGLRTNANVLDFGNTDKPGD